MNPTLIERRGVAIVVQNPGGRLLVSKRLGCKAFNGLWQFPGGSVEKHETSPVAANRELYEETGLLLDLDYLACGVFLNEVGTLTYMEFYIGKVSDNDLVENKEPLKQSDWVWLSTMTLRTMALMPFMQELLEKKIKCTMFN